MPCHAHRHLPACFRVQSRLPPRQGEGCALCPLPLGRLGRHLAQGTAPSQDDTLRATQEDNLFNLGMVYFILNSSIFNAVLISGSFIYVNSCSQNFKCQCPFSHTPPECQQSFLVFLIPKSFQNGCGKCQLRLEFTSVGQLQVCVCFILNYWRSQVSSL